MTVVSNTSAVVSRLQARLKKLSPDNKEVRAALTRAGILIAMEAKFNIRRQALIDTGRLFNSILYEVEQDKQQAILRIGSFGVPYAAVHEFGYQGTVNIRGHRRLMVKVFGKPVDPREIDIAPHSRFMRIPERPYLRPAIETHRNRLVDLLREAAGFA